MPNTEQEKSIAETAALRAGNKPPDDARSEFQKLHDRVVQIEQELFGEGATGIRPYRSTRDRKIAETLPQSVSKPYIPLDKRHGDPATTNTLSGPKLVK